MKRSFIFLLLLIVLPAFGVKLNRDEIRPTHSEKLEMDFKIAEKSYDDLDYTNARILYERCAKQNINPAIKAQSDYKLGLVYVNGLGIQQNYGIAKNYFEKAANQATSPTVRAKAWLQLGTQYALGRGVKTNKNHARGYFDRVSTIPSADARTLEAADHWLRSLRLFGE